MSFLTEQVKADLLRDIESFAETTDRFYKKEVSIRDYKGYSGGFGSFAERGAGSGMFRMRLPGGRIRHEHLGFIADVIERYELPVIHCTTGQSLQFHKLDGKRIVALFKECHAKGIYSRGCGGNYIHNITGPALSGVHPAEQFVVAPYVAIMSEYILSQILYIDLPNKFKTAFVGDYETASHGRFKDIGFLAKPEGRFDVYAAGGIGAASAQGVCVGRDVAPEDILYYMKAMLLMSSEEGDRTSHTKGRTRFILARLGEEAFVARYKEFLARVQAEENLAFTLPVEPKRGIAVASDANVQAASHDAAVLTHPRIGAQKQAGLYYVSYHPVGGTIPREVFLELLHYLSNSEGTEIRLTGEEGLYIVNLTAEEAKTVAAMTEDGARTRFEASVSCIGSTVCQIGFQDSQGLLATCIRRLREEGLSHEYLPKIHISGCPSSCGTHQVGHIGFHGAVKLVDKKPVPGFTMFVGGSEEHGRERFGKQLGVMAATDIPEFFVALAKLLQDAKLPYEAWIGDHQEELEALAGKFI